MRVYRSGQAKQSLQINLPGSGIQQIDAPNHFGNALFVIVKHSCQVVGVYAVAAENDEVPDFLFEVLCQRSLEQVLKRYG